MEQLLHRGAAISDLAYLRVLQLVHIQSSSLVDDLKAYELPNVSPRVPSDVTEFRRSLTGAAAPAAGTPAVVGTMLEMAMEELFVPYTEGQRYLERESRSLGTLYSNLLANFTRYHVGSDHLVRCKYLICHTLAGKDTEREVVNVRPYGRSSGGCRSYDIDGWCFDDVGPSGCCTDEIWRHQC